MSDGDQSTWSPFKTRSLLNLASAQGEVRSEDVYSSCRLSEPAERAPVYPSASWSVVVEACPDWIRARWSGSRCMALRGYAVLPERAEIDVAPSGLAKHRSVHFESSHLCAAAARTLVDARSDGSSQSRTVQRRGARFSA